jgi:hypothetical protein
MRRSRRRFSIPAAREVEDAASLLNEAEVEHGTAKDLIATLDSMDASDEMFSATFTVCRSTSSITSRKRKASSSPRS